MVAIKNQLLGGLLVEKYEVDSAVMNRALEESRNRGIRLGEYLISEFGVSEEAIYQAMAEQFGIPFINEIEPRIDEKLLRELPIELFSEGRCFPLSQTEREIQVVVFDPLDLDILLSVEFATGKKVLVSMTTASQIERVWDKLFVTRSIATAAASQIVEEFEKSFDHDARSRAPTASEIMKHMESEPVVKMVRLLFDDAIAQNASDVHIEPTEDNAIIRFRIDGMLIEHMKITKWMFLPVTSRMKILADLDIAERRMPQDGRIAYDVDGQKFDLRVSTLPTHYGEKTVVRILKHDKELLDLGRIGLNEHDLETLVELINRPKGMICVTGPTGSGKSTALFACLNKVKDKAINITTIENPIEYKLKGINQVQVNEKAGLSFAATLRSILRQDPDVILVGEIRDRETAEIAMQAAQTGHLVFTTLHTNDAVAAITRLKDLGVAPFVIASSLLAVMGQRLVRTLCPKCKRKAPFTENMRDRWRSALGSEIPLPTHYYRAVGCKACNQIGYSGRLGVFELAVVNEKVRDLISSDVQESEMRRLLKKLGMKAMIENGIEKITEGITTPEEILRVVSIEDNAANEGVSA